MAGEFFASPASFRLNGAARWASPGSTLAALAKNSTGSLGHNNGIQVGQIRCAKWAMPDARFTEQGIRNKISRWLSDSFVREALHYELEHRENRWRLSLQVDHPALEQLWSRRLGRTVLLTNRLDWSAEQVLAGYSGQQESNAYFAGSKTGNG